MIKIKLIMKFTQILLLSIFIVSCESVKPRAQGADNELVVVSSLEDRPAIKNILTTIFSDTLFTPQPEAYYKTVWVSPENFNDVNDRVNVIVAAVGSHPRNMGVKLIKQVLSPSQYKSSMDEDNQLIFAKDVFARDQNYLIINGPSQNKIIETAKDKGPWLNKQFEDLFFKRQSIHLFEGSSRQKELENRLLDDYGWTFKIPWGYTIIKEDNNEQFFWMGRDIPYRWLAVKWEEGLAFSDSISVSKYVQKIPSDYFKSIQHSNYMFKVEPDRFKDWGAWKITGLWESIEEAQGGPFISYLFYDEPTNRTYFIYMMIFHPGNDKYLLLRQVDIIANSFKLN